MRVPRAGEAGEELRSIAAEVVVCRKCPRLVAWREEAALLRPKRYAGKSLEEVPRLWRDDFSP